MRLRSRGCNVYLVGDERMFLIDAGTNAAIITRQVRELDGILITHAHFDHVAACYELQKVFGCPVYVHELDMPYLLGEESFRFSGVLGVIAKLAEKLTRFRPPEDVRSIEEGGVEFVHTPGHTPGSVCVICGGDVYCGDLVRGNGRPKLSYRSFCSDYKAYLRSVAKLSEIEFSTLHPGHGRSVRRKEFEELVARLRFS